MSTLGEVVRQARGLLLGTAIEPRAVLAVDWTVDDPTVTLRDPIQGIVSGVTVEVGWTELVVTSVNSSTKTLTVVPEDGTFLKDAAAGTVVRIRPKYPLWQIIAQANNELRDLSAPSNGLYRVEAFESLSTGFPLPNDTMGLVRAYSGTTGLANSKAIIARGLDPAVYPTGVELTGGQATRALVARPFRLIIDPDPTADIADVTGLPETAIDILPLGVGVRASTARESQRADLNAQGDTRRADEVQPGAATMSVRNMSALRQTRIIAEAERLTRLYGLRF